MFDNRGGTLNGVLNGGLGSDFYVTVDSDLEIIAVGADIGAVNAACSFALALNIENLTLLGSGNFSGTGNAGVNVIFGNAGNNVLTGLAGNDTMSGGTAAFARIAGQLRVAQSGGITCVEMGVNGDSLADIMIRVNGLPNLTASDFVL